MFTRLIFAGALLIASSALCGCVFDFSPDGTEIVYFDMGEKNDRRAPSQSDNSGPKRADLLLNRTDGSAASVLKGEGFGIAQQPCWSPDGKTIAYVQEHISGGGVFLFDVATRRTQKLLATQGTLGVMFLGWKPDGSRLLVARPIGGPDFKGVLEWFDPKTKKAGARIQFSTTRNDFLVLNQRPIWQPNSNNVFLFSSATRGMEAMLALPNEGKLMPVGNIGGIAGAGVSGDGQKMRVLTGNSFELPLRLEFQTARFGESPMTWKTTGALDVKKICAPQIPSRIEGALFSPDGRRIALTVRFAKGKPDAFPLGPQQFALYLLDADGKNAKLIRRTQFFNSETKNHFPVAWFITRWSRNSQSLGVHFSDAHQTGLFVYDAQGHLKSRLPTPNLTPSFQPTTPRTPRSTS